MDAVYLSQRVNPDMLIAGHGFISLTGATAALPGRAGLRRLQSLTREFHLRHRCGCSVNPAKEFTLST
jgi:hypothetical protein